MYLTLPSSASKDIFPDNNPSSYNIQLSSSIHLTDKREVALVEISYNNNFKNVPDFDVVIFLKDKEKKIHSIDGGHFKNLNSLLHNINAKIKEAKFYYDNYLDRCYFVINNGISNIEMIDNLSKTVLGFDINKNYETVKDGKKTMIAGHPPVITRPFDTLFIYSDIIEETVVGDKEAKLMRTVPITGLFNERVNYEFRNAHYHPIEKSEISRIEIDIRDDTGTRIDFGDEEVSLTLHLRWRST